MKIALMDSGIGLLPAARAVRRLRPDADLVLSSDPDGMPWGPRTPADLTERALVVARAAAEHRPDALIVACNTASVHALPTLRAELEPDLPVIGTVPAIKPAAAGHGPFAIWATPATTGSPYQRDLIRRFASSVAVTEVPCPGLADAVQHVDEEAIDRAVATAAALTPRDVRAVVLGCTHYELVAERVRAAVQRPGGPTVVLYGSAGAVAAQAMRRAGDRSAPGAAGVPGTPVAPVAPAVPGVAAVPRVPDGAPDGLPGVPGTAGLLDDPDVPEAPTGILGVPGGRLTVLLSGRESTLPEEALAYVEGRQLAAVSRVR
ncbi:aspartate/glutamate racemase family protein [Streptomyces sp. NPDC095613]|uniref:glutamate racemase n=1 Tax=Streptomyces sp. NPDC095613 TaxID=3155540 RepID=UPI003318D8D8